MKKETKVYVYKGLFFVASIVFIVIFLRSLGKISNLIDTLSQISWYFIAAILALQAIGIVNRGAFYHSLYDFFHIKDSLKRFITLSLSSNFANMVAPTGGITGMAIFVSESERHGLSKTKATFVNAFSYILYYGVFVFVLLFGLFYLLFNNQLHQYQLITAAVLIGMILFLVIVIVAAIEEAARLKKLFKFFAAIANFFARVILNRNFFIKRADVHFASEDINEMLKFIGKSYKKLWLPIFHVILIEAIDIMTLYYLFIAFGYSIYPGILITAYAISVLFTLVSITPSGVGFVEAAMIVVLTNLKVPVELSAVVVFSYRLIVFWIPFVMGYFTFRIFQKNKIEVIESESN